MANLGCGGKIKGHMNYYVCQKPLDSWKLKIIDKYNEPWLPSCVSFLTVTLE